MTLEVKQKLQTELDELEAELRIHLPKEIKRAREFGDLRENSEYQTALQRQTMVNELARWDRLIFPRFRTTKLVMARPWFFTTASVMKK